MAKKVKRSVDVVIKGYDRASREFKRLESRTRRLGRTFSALKVAVAGAAAAATYMAVRTMKDSLAAFAEQEAAERELAAALALVGDEAAATMPRMKEFAAEIQRTTTIGDEAVLQLMAMGASMGKLSGEALQDATKAAIGLSRAFKLDMVAAMRLVARASVGDTATLKRYGITLKEGLTAQQKFNEVLRIGQENFKLAEAETDTYAGRMKQLHNIIGDLKERLVAVLAPIIMRVAEKMRDALINVDVMLLSFKKDWLQFCHDLQAGWGFAWRTIMTWAQVAGQFINKIIAWIADQWQTVTDQLASGIFVAMQMLKGKTREEALKLYAEVMPDTEKWGDQFRADIEESQKYVVALWNDYYARQKEANERLKIDLAAVDEELKDIMGGMRGDKGDKSAEIRETRRRTQALETRFLTGREAGIRVDEKIEANTRVMVDIMKRQEKLQERLVEAERAIPGAADYLLPLNAR